MMTNHLAPQKRVIQPIGDCLRVIYRVPVNAPLPEGVMDLIAELDKISDPSLRRRD